MRMTLPAFDPGARLVVARPFTHEGKTLKRGARAPKLPERKLKQLHEHRYLAHPKKEQTNG